MAQPGQVLVVRFDYYSRTILQSHGYFSVFAAAPISIPEPAGSIRVMRVILVGSGIPFPRPGSPALQLGLYMQIYIDLKCLSFPLLLLCLGVVGRSP
jgi:hypothetical protein